MSLHEPRLDDVIDVVRSSIPGNPSVDPDTELLGAGLLDSISILETLNRLESRYQVMFPPELIVPETFLTATTIWRALVSCVSMSPTVPES